MSDDGAEPGWGGSPAEELQSGSPRARRRVGLPAALTGIVVLIVAVGVAVVVAHGGQSHEQPRAQPVPHASAGDAQPSLPPGPARAAPRRESAVNVPLLGITAPWELFGRSATDVVRIQFARGLVTLTSLPALASNGPVSFVVGPQGAVVRPLDLVPGYLVPDGQVARPLTGALSHGGPVVPGPHPGQLWVETHSGAHVTMSLIDRAGHRTGVALRLPPAQATVMSDGRGYLLLKRSDGVYDARPGGRRRITAGQLLAVGPTRWLTRRCDGAHHCETVVINRISGSRRVLSRGSGSEAFAPVGVISPNGAVAALPSTNPNRPVSIRLVDLDTGADHRLGISVGADGDVVSQVVWSPDSRWLFVATAKGELVAVPARAGRVRTLGVVLPRLIQLAVREPSTHRARGPNERLTHVYVTRRKSSH